jgi:phosphate transport system substrate-binding protein
LEELHGAHPNTRHGFLSEGRFDEHPIHKAKGLTAWKRAGCVARRTSRRTRRRPPFGFSRVSASPAAAAGEHLPFGVSTMPTTAMIGGCMERIQAMNLRLVTRALIGAVAAMTVARPLGAQVKVDPKLPAYKAVKGVSGRLAFVGSDTMNNLVSLWCKGFVELNPDVQLERKGGATTGPPALTAGTVQFAPMSRPMKPIEINNFKKKHGHAPTGLTTSFEMLGVCVYKDNPIKGLTLKQVDAIFSRTRKGGYPKPINKWGDAGLQGEWMNKPIVLYGRNSASGSYSFFKGYALFNGDFRDDLKEQRGDSAIAERLAGDKFGIGYCGIAFRTVDTRAVPLAADEKSDFVAAEPEQARKGKYPLARKLYLYVNHDPAKKLDPLRAEFIRYVFSKQGQAAVIKAGHVPVDSVAANKALKTVGLD